MLVVERRHGVPSSAKAYKLGSGDDGMPLHDVRQAVGASTGGRGSGSGSAGTGGGVSAWRVTAAMAGLWRRLLAGLTSMFLPDGYPNSVSPEYITFQFWDTVQAMCSYLRGILATRALLEGVGVGDDAATPMAATLQWVTRDGASMLGSLMFAWWGGARFDADVKRWRLFADVINDVGLTLEMLAPLAGPTWFLAVACAGCVCKSLCGVAAGSTRAALTAHFARTDNLAEVAAKEGSQETAVTLLGLVCGMWFARAVNQHATAIWLAFGLLTVLHVISNYKAVNCLRLRHLNPARVRVAVRLCAAGEAVTVNNVNALQPLAPTLPCSSSAAVELRMGVSVAEFGTVAQLSQALRSLPGEHFAVRFVARARCCSLLAGRGRAPYAAVVALAADAEPIDELRALVLVTHAERVLADGTAPAAALSSAYKALARDMGPASDKADGDAPLLRALKRGGFLLDKVRCASTGWRYSCSQLPGANGQSGINSSDQDQSVPAASGKAARAGRRRRRSKQRRPTTPAPSLTCLPSGSCLVNKHE